jgi:hypothetical protein
VGEALGVQTDDDLEASAAGLKLVIFNISMILMMDADIILQCQMLDMGHLN